VPFACGVNVPEVLEAKEIRDLPRRDERRGPWVSCQKSQPVESDGMELSPIGGGLLQAVAIPWALLSGLDFPFSGTRGPQGWLTIVQGKASLGRESQYE